MDFWTFLYGGGSAVAEDADPNGVTPTLPVGFSKEKHNKIFHPNGRHEGDTCKYDAMAAEEADAKGDELGESDEGDDKPFNNGLVTQEEDAEYAKAVENGDNEKAQEMILTLAKKAMPNNKIKDRNGMPSIVWHGSKNDFTVFKNQDTSYGFFFAPDKKAADYYGPSKPYFIKSENVANLDDSILLDKLAKEIIPVDNYNVHRDEEELESVFQSAFDCDDEQVQQYIKSTLYLDDDECKDFTYDEWYEKLQECKDDYDRYIDDYPEVKKILDENAPMHDYRGSTVAEAYGSQEFYMNYQSDILSEAEGEGYDSVKMTDPSSTGESQSVVAFKPNQIKSADITYDDEGKLIPISQRFDFSNPDIRY